MVPSFPHSVPRGGGSATAANLFFLRPNPFLSKVPFVTLLSNVSANSISAATTSTSTAVGNSVSAAIVPQPSSLNPDPRLFYGPSLRKGTPNPNPTLFSQEEGTEEEEGAIFDESLFTRVFEIAAIRVPSEQCFALENHLRGHLLNWPRIRNVARVPGDDVDPVLQKLLDSGNNSEEHGDGVDHEGNLNSLSRRLYGKAEGDGERLSPVLYRDKLAKTFNSRGFVKFRNLAKLSRPKKKKKKTTKRGEEEGSGRGYPNCRGVGKSGPATVEAVEDMEAVGDLKGLLGNEFKGGRNWRGPTRLLLLDEKYAHKGACEMPEAIKAVLSEGPTKSAMPNIEIVRCKLTLSYDYWQMNEVLEALLPDGMIVPSAFETVGHIAHLNLKDEHLPYKKLIAKVVLDKNSKKIHTVVNKMEAIHSDYRTMQLEVLAGNHSLVTRVVENGIRFQVDLATVYWNSRLATERQRLVNCFTHKDIVCDVFSGVGPLAISAAKKVKRVYANDLNPYAVEYLERNCVLNKLERKIQVFNMDGRRFIDALFASQNKNSITQVVMNLPNDAVEYLDAFRGIFGRKFNDKELTLPKIHVYGFSKARDPEFDFHERIRIGLSEVAVDVEMRRVRLVAPGKWMLCASFKLPESVAFARTVRGESEW